MMFYGKINLRGKVMQAGYLCFLDFEISIPCRLHRRFSFETGPDYSLIAISKVVKH